MQKNMTETFFFEIIAPGHVAKIVSIKKRILAIGSECVKKQSKILHITKRDFFQLNCVESNQ